MVQYLKYIIQIILSPSNGWEDVDENMPSTGEMFRKGFLPLMIISALTEFFGLLYNKGYTFDVLLIKAIIDFGSYLIAFYIGRMVFDVYIVRLVSKVEIGTSRVRGLQVLLLGLGVMLLMQIVYNCFQADITILKFLPMYTILIIYKASDFMRINSHDYFLFTLIASLSIVVLPLVIYNFLNMFIL